MSQLDTLTKEELVSLDFKNRLASLYSYLSKQLGIQESPTLKVINNKQNSTNPFGFTGHYNPETKQIVLYITDRHDTDILRSFAHELIHHWQNERGTLISPQSNNEADPNSHSHYAQDDSWLRRREMEAYLFGNILFRDWQDEQRMGPPKTKPTLPLPLDENLRLKNQKLTTEMSGIMLKNKIEMLVKDLIDSGLFNSYNRTLSSGKMNPSDFANDLVHRILSSIRQWLDTVNNRGNWENEEGGMIK